MRAVIDTGVLVSGLIRRQGPPAAVLQALAEGLKGLPTWPIGTQRPSARRGSRSYAKWYNCCHV